MISPIQQNVVFKGEACNKPSDNFTGAMPAQKSVRGDYSSTIEKIDDIQENVQTKIDNHTGKNLNLVV